MQDQSLNNLVSKICRILQNGETDVVKNPERLFPSERPPGNSIKKTNEKVRGNLI